MGNCCCFFQYDDEYEDGLLAHIDQAAREGSTGDFCGIAPDKILSYGGKSDPIHCGGSRYHEIYGY